MPNFSGKTALITGASGGIGAATSRILHKHGANLIITGTNIEKLNKLKEELGERCELKLCDLSNLEQVRDLTDNIEKIDILVCNAGITKDQISIRMSEEDFKSVLDVNLTANFILNKSIARKMMKNDYGRIINIASIVANTGNVGQANYCAAKAGLIGMSKVFALEFAAKNITVNIVSPGFIVTNMTDKLNDTIKDSMLTKIPQKRFGEALDIAHAIMFLASEEARYITGHTLHVNGGMLMA